MPASRKQFTKQKNNERLIGPEVCTGGAGFNKRNFGNVEPHIKRWQSTYDDPSRGLRGILIPEELAENNYTCRKCRVYQGCHACIADVADLICRNCRDWANDISENVHGKMIYAADLKAEGMKLVRKVHTGVLRFNDFQKLWTEACTVLRDGPREMAPGAWEKYVEQEWSDRPAAKQEQAAQPEATQPEVSTVAGLFTGLFPNKIALG